jgi:hypothetical protein
MARTYKSREGKVVKHRGTEYVVTGCHKDIGLTIQEKGTSYYALCINGPMSPITRQHYGSYKKVPKEMKETYYAMMEYCIKCIDNNMLPKLWHYSISKGTNAPTLGSSPPSASTCPFAQ